MGNTPATEPNVVKTARESQCFVVLTFHPSGDTVQGMEPAAHALPLSGAGVRRETRVETAPGVRRGKGDVEWTFLTGL